MKTIEINVFDPKSINDALRELDNVEKSLDDKTNRAIKNITFTAETEISARCASADKDTDIDNVYELNDYQTGENERTIVLAGHSVLFEEFGTGITKSDSPEARADLTYGDVLNHGEYGRGQGANPNGWKLNGKHTFGINAQTPMYSAKKKVKEQMANIAKDTFEND